MLLPPFLAVFIYIGTFPQSITIILIPIFFSYSFLFFADK